MSSLKNLQDRKVELNAEILTALTNGEDASVLMEEMTSLNPEIEKAENEEKINIVVNGSFDSLRKQLNLIVYKMNINALIEDASKEVAVTFQAIEKIEKVKNQTPKQKTELKALNVDLERYNESLSSAIEVEEDATNVTIGDITAVCGELLTISKEIKAELPKVKKGRKGSDASATEKQRARDEREYKKAVEILSEGGELTGNLIPTHARILKGHDEFTDLTSNGETPNESQAIRNGLFLKYV